MQALANDSATKALHGLFSAVLSGDMAGERQSVAPILLMHIARTRVCCPGHTWPAWRSDASHPPVVDGPVICSATLAAFRAAATPAALEAAGTSLEAATTKARLVALLALCSKSSHEEVGTFSSRQCDERSGVECGGRAEKTVCCQIRPSQALTTNRRLDRAPTDQHPDVLAACCPQVPFSAIQKALDVADGQVEGWVVRAIGAKLIEAKIDQVGQEG